MSQDFDFLFINPSLPQLVITFKSGNILAYGSKLQIQTVIIHNTESELFAVFRHTESELSSINDDVVSEKNV